MRFLNPLLLLGLAAVAIPIIIHLINRQKAVRIRFPAIQLLIRSNRRVARRIKLKQLLLLALRICLFLLIPLAMAQPYLLCGGEERAEGRLPASVVFVVDDSGSMSYRGEEGAFYEQAVDLVDDRIRALRAWDQAALIFSHHEPDIAVGDLTDDRSDLSDALDAHEPAFTGSSLPDALRVARDIQLTSELPVRRTVVVTDGTAAAWGGDEMDSSVVAGLGQLEIVDLSEGRALGNLAITDASYGEANEGGAGNYRLEAIIRSYGYDQTEAGTVTAYLDGAPIAVLDVDVEPQTPAVVAFTHRITGEGLHELRFELEEESGSTADNVRYLPVRLNRSVRALLVNGDVRAVQYNDELYYLERALGVTIEQQRSIELQTTVPDRLDPGMLDTTDVVVLANVGSLSAVQIQALEAFVRSGGGLLITPGDNVEPERWNSLFGSLLPKPVRSVTVLSERRDPDASIKATRIATVDWTHPVFRVFSQPGGQSLQSATAYQYLLLEPTADSASSILASYGDGGPALLERPLGQGRVLLLTTTIDMDWSDLPIRTAFVPFTKRLVQYLARRGGQASGEATVGERFMIDVEAYQPERVTVVSPDGGRNVLEVDGGTVGFVPRRAGHHAVFATLAGEEVEVPELAFAANLPAAEADLSTASAELVAQYERAAVDEGDAGRAGALDIPQRRTPVWPYVLFVALLLVYLESAVSIRRRLWQRIREQISGRDPIEL